VDLFRPSQNYPVSLLKHRPQLTIQSLIEVLTCTRARTWETEHIDWGWIQTALQELELGKVLQPAIIYSGLQPLSLHPNALPMPIWPIKAMITMSQLTGLTATMGLFSWSKSVWLLPSIYSLTTMAKSRLGTHGPIFYNISATKDPKNSMLLPLILHGWLMVMSLSMMNTWCLRVELTNSSRKRIATLCFTMQPTTQSGSQLPMAPVL
jgi:hypothetical protein